jgi:hypothetical protein
VIGGVSRYEYGNPHPDPKGESRKRCGFSPLSSGTKAAQLHERNCLMEVPDIQTTIQENTAEHERLAKLVAGLTDEELARPLAAGWTVAAELAHLAFWDARAILLIDKWKREGIGPSPADIDILNDAAKELCLAIPPRAAAELALRKSLEINRAIERLTPDMVGRVQAIGPALHLARHEHKRAHLDEIERGLGRE